MLVPPYFLARSTNLLTAALSETEGQPTSHHQYALGAQPVLWRRRRPRRKETKRDE